MKELALNRSQRRKNNVKITKKDLHQSYKLGKNAGIDEAVKTTMEKSLQVLHEEFGFGEKRLNRFIKAFENSVDKEVQS